MQSAVRAPLAVAAAGLMSSGSIAAGGLHPLVAFVPYAVAICLLVVAATSRRSAISERLATTLAAAALTAAVGILLLARIEVAPLALVSVVPLVAIGRLVIGPARIEGTGPALLSLALIVALADRQIFSPFAVTPELLLAAVVAIAAVFVGSGARQRLAIYGLTLFAYAIAVGAILGAQPYRTDTVVATHGAAELLLAGHHPYADFDMFERLDRFGIPRAFATDLEDGTSLRSLNYPALSFLLPAPLIAAGLTDVRFLYLAEVLGLLALITWSAREPWRPYVLAAGIGCIAVAHQHVIAGVDPSWALLITAAWLARGSRWSAILTGLAISARQTVWPLAAALLLWTWLSRGPREALWRGSVALALALVVHAPFLITAPEAVIGGIFDVIVQPIIAGGVGPSFLALRGVIPELPRALYFALAGAGLLIVAWAYVGRRVMVTSALSLPLLPTFLAWRGLQSYLALTPLLSLVEEGRDDPERMTLPAPPSSGSAPSPR